MAKVVGKDKKAIKRITCYGCASIIEYAKNEVVYAEYKDWGGDTQGWKYIVCPKCKHRVEVGD